MVFHVLNKEDIRKIVTLLLKTLEKRCAEQMEIHLTVTDVYKRQASGTDAGRRI